MGKFLWSPFEQVATRLLASRPLATIDRYQLPRRPWLKCPRDHYPQASSKSDLKPSRLFSQDFGRRAGHPAFPATGHAPASSDQETGRRIVESEEIDTNFRSPAVWQQSLRQYR